MSFAELQPFVTNPDSPVYCLRDLPEEVTSVLFAYVSRSANSFRENLRALLGEEGIAAATGSTAPSTGLGAYGFDPASETARRFHEKWVVGYGHASVAEHSVLHYGLEQVSILATKLLEDARLASYTEKSTRYQYFGRDTVRHDPDLAASPLGPACEAGLLAQMDAYRDTFAALDAFLRRKVPPKPDTNPKAYEAALHAQVCDAARYLLPLATRTMVAVTVNAREAAWMITKLLSSPLAEARELGLALRAEGRKICPTLLRHADANAFLPAAAGLAMTAAAEIPRTASGPGLAANGVRLVSATPDPAGLLGASALDHLLGLWLAEHGHADLAATRRHLAGQTEAAKLELLDRLHAAMGPHDVPPRAFEGLHATFEVTVDYGAFRDIQRHRIGLQLNPLLDTSLGYETPDEIVEAGLEPAYRQQMERSAELYARAAARFPVQAQYLLPLAWRKRVLFDWDLREVAHFVRLRSAPQGHISYRRLAWQMRDAVVAAYPFAAPFLPVDRNRYALGRLEAHGRVE